MATNYDLINQDFAVPEGYRRNQEGDYMNSTGQLWDPYDQYQQSLNQSGSMGIAADDMQRWTDTAQKMGMSFDDYLKYAMPSGWTTSTDKYGSTIYNSNDGSVNYGGFPQANWSDGTEGMWALPLAIAGAGAFDMGLFGNSGGLFGGGDTINTSGLFDISGFDNYNPISLMNDVETGTGALGAFPSGPTNYFPSGTTGLESIMPNTWAGSGTGLASSITPTSLGGTLGGTAAAGGGFWDQISSLFNSGASSVGNALTQMIPNSANMGNTALSGLLNYFMQSQRQNDLQSAAERSAQLNDPMQQPQRLPYQAALANLMFNPQGYAMSPYAQGQTNLANQAFQANVSKYGPGGTQFNDYLKNFQNIMSADFFKLADQFQTAGGFNQGAGGAGSAYGNLAGQAANAGPSAFEGFGALFSQPRQTSVPSGFDFSTTYKPQENPFGQSWTASM